MWEYQYPDELYHWKYIKKKKVNGKWRYYYDKDELIDDAKDAVGLTAREAAVKSMNMLDRRQLQKVVSEYDLRRNKSGSVNYQKNIVKDANEYIRYSNAYDAQKKRTERAIKKYLNTPLGRIEKAANKGRRILEILLS